jgi:hypothetical protein
MSLFVNHFLVGFCFTAIIACISGIMWALDENKVGAALYFTLGLALSGGVMVACLAA